MQAPAWKIDEIREQIQIIDGKKSPSMLVKNATYLHSVFKTWERGNIWIDGDRIVYVGPELPLVLDGTEIIDATPFKIVPGYIEPHVHPFQLYNPQTFGQYAASRGTTTFLADNLMLFLSLENESVFELLDELKKQPFTYYWWARFDSQTVLANEDELFHSRSIGDWLERPDVLMGGELTGWTRLLAGDDQMLYWLQMAKRKGKKIEGHFPGASDKTLTRMRLFGADGDHESMTVEEVERRLRHGYGVTLRHSSIRPDLPHLLKSIVEKGWNVFDHLMMTTDGSTPSFHLDGVMDKCIQAALDAGVSPIDAYQMASYNAARYYNMSHLHGMVATGRIAHLNFLSSENEPTPVRVLASGQWLKTEEGVAPIQEKMDWSVLGTLELDFELVEDDFDFSMPLGIEMVNDVITKPYAVSTNLGENSLPKDTEELFLMLVDRKGKWHVNTIIKGFGSSIEGFASSYSNTGDIILIGKSKSAMKAAFDSLKERKGGIVLLENGEVVTHLPLAIDGSLSDQPFEVLVEQELALKEELTKRGFRHGDAIYTLLFLQSTHLPYVRITQKGLYDVMKKEVLIPSFMRTGG
ncbi:adenine deaminase C-terminal domain-containing protein [Paenisporosarcina cavernae]|uniref:adenine deaminase n=1 Tax=Paenisporosarcina cavernae TaxID=2320858 RepID=A0A385YTV1_9BACL|nr:adenine deaminase C-terminal domain-containing protein [Paenisporosarcina cavernae]AYC30305.1 adenine deaminase [Paenisporosarcina cavernae]